MAYFANGSEGMCFGEQCEKCKFGNNICPIEAIQMIYNYDAVGNKIATAILDDLVKNDGTCMMYKTFKSYLHNPNYATPNLPFEE
jgi:formate hydrogenlyase subunit 6/NADH:ubiquinone oxidoreductase subunit I